MGKENGINNMNNQGEISYTKYTNKNKYSALFDDNDDKYIPPKKQESGPPINKDIPEIKKLKNKKNIKLVSFENDNLSNDSQNNDTDKNKDTNKEKNITINENSENGSDIELPSLWHLYEHNSENKNWKIDSYNDIYTVSNASNLWKLVNNFYRLDFKKYDFFLMKNDILPIWEHPKNRDGSICSIRTDINNGSDAVCLILLYLVTNKLYTDGTDDINGISCSVRNNWMVIKIWCGFKEDKLINILQNGLLSKLNNLTFKHI
jgi:hypothetical protein